MHGGTAAPTPWDEQRVTRFVRAAVARKRGMFTHFPDLSADDLVQSVLMECRKDFHGFDPARSSLSTWVGRVAGTTLIDLWRSRARRADRDAAYASRPGVVSPGEMDDQELAAWLRGVYRMVGETTVTAVMRWRQGRRFHNVAQQVACALLMQELNLSTRGAERLFRAREDLARAVRFKHVPNHRWFGAAREVAPEVAPLFLEKSEESLGGE